MREYSYTVTLTSDGEPGTGMGGENVNGLVPRDNQNRLVLRASHIKGLMREQLTQLSISLGWHPSWLAVLFGKADSQSDRDAAIRLSDAVADQVTTRTISRTAIETGSRRQKADGSLRTVEAVPVGTKFTGSIYYDADDEALTAMWQLALQSIASVGGNRSRGAGQCIVSIDKTEPDFIQLMGKVKEIACIEHESIQPNPANGDVTTAVDLSAEKVVCLQLSFTAEAPICCPEVADKTNAIRSGFAIPASAVQGVILHRLGKVNRNLASATFDHDAFRAWPLLPIGDASRATTYVNPVRVGLTHRGAKFALSESFGSDHFQDESFESFDWTTVPSGAPLKAFDGVLLQDTGKNVILWKASQMPHVVTVHGVRNDQSDPIDGSSDSDFRTGGRNLFSVDSMAPLVWCGQVFLPERAASQLIESLKDDGNVSFGKGRSVRGHGTLVANEIEEIHWRSDTWSNDFDVLLAQSPIKVPPSAESAPEQTVSAEQTLMQLVQDWIESNDFKDLCVQEAWATTSLRFGWNRTTRGQGKEDGFIGACLVIDPGATIKLSRRLEPDELDCLRHGIGDGRKEGYGAVSLHPGKASGLFAVSREQRKLKSQGKVADAIKLAIKIAKGPVMPSSSQWSALRAERNLGVDQAATYLDRQLEDRTSRIYATWEGVANDVKGILEMDEDAAISALTFLSHKSVDRKRGE